MILGPSGELLVRTEPGDMGGGMGVSSPVEYSIHSKAVGLYHQQVLPTGFKSSIKRSESGRPGG